MKFRLLNASLSIVAVGAAVFIVSAQQPDDEVRGAFIESRPKTTNLTSPSRRHRRRPANANARASSNSLPSVSSEDMANANTPGKPGLSKVMWHAIGPG